MYKFVYFGASEQTFDQKIIDQLYQLDTSDFLWPWTREVWRSLKNQEQDYIAVVVYFEEKLIGFSLLKICALEDLAHLLKIIVQDNFKEKGIGLDIMHRAIEWLKLHKMASRIYLEVEEHNQPAIQLYKRLHFESLRIIKGFYSNGANAIPMELCIK